MKFKYDAKKQKAEVDMNVEKLIEKGMEQHEKTWKEKFNTKHSAKKEVLELKHKQKIEIDEKNEQKKSWFQKIEEEKRKTREFELQLELDEIRREKEEQKQILRAKIIATIVLGIIGSLLLIIGYAFGSTSMNGDSRWDGVLIVGFFALVSIYFIWKEQKNKKWKK